MKKCFVSVVSDHYIDSFLTLLYSVKKHNPYLTKIQWRVFVNNEWCPLSEVNRAKIIKIWPTVNFVHVDISDYRNINAQRAVACFNNQNSSRKANPNGARTWFMKFHILRMTDVDQVIYLDSDILCIRDISELINSNCNFGAVIRRYKGGYTRKKQSGMHFNAGVMLIGKSFMTNWYHDRAVKYANRNNRNGDQEAWWALTNNHNILFLNKMFNINPNKPKKGGKLIHFFGKKPWEREPNEMRRLDNVWMKYYNKMKESLK